MLGASALLRRGRPKLRFKDYKLDLGEKYGNQVVCASLFWDQKHNSELDLSSIGIAEEAQCQLHCLCWKHSTVKSPKAVVDNWKRGSKTALDCRVCHVFRDPKKGRKPSKYEKQCYTILRDLKVGWLAEVRVLKGTCSSADVWVHESNLIIMLDGEGHFGKIYGTPVWKQKDVDDRFNAAAATAGFHVLRLHFADTKHFKKNIMDTVSRCTALNKPTIFFSFYYSLGKVCRDNLVPE